MNAVNCILGVPIIGDTTAFYEKCDEYDAFYRKDIGSKSMPSCRDFDATECTQELLPMFILKRVAGIASILVAPWKRDEFCKDFSIRDAKLSSVIDPRIMGFMVFDLGHIWCVRYDAARGSWQTIDTNSSAPFVKQQTLAANLEQLFDDYSRSGCGFIFPVTGNAIVVWVQMYINRLFSNLISHHMFAQESPDEEKSPLIHTQAGKTLRFEALRVDPRNTEQSLIKSIRAVLDYEMHDDLKKRSIEDFEPLVAKIYDLLANFFIETSIERCSRVKEFFKLLSDLLCEDTQTRNKKVLEELPRFILYCLHPALYLQETG